MDWVRKRDMMIKVGFSNSYATQVGVRDLEYKHLKANSFASVPLKDTVKFSSAKSLNNSIQFHKSGNTISVVTFTGLKNPTALLPPALQMRVSGVTRFQKAAAASKFQNACENINKLADSMWKDGDRLKFEFIKGKVILVHPKFGDIGRVPDEIATEIYPVMKKDKNNFYFELSNVIAGTTKGAETIGLRVNLLYKGKNQKNINKVRAAFNNVLNDKECAEKVMLYQPKTSIQDILKVTLDYENNVNGPESAKTMMQIINNIAKVLKDPENKRILVAGHCKPDGDTYGGCKALENAIGLAFPDKHVDVAIDDKIPGLFRHKIKGFDEGVKVPHSSEYVSNLQKEIKELEKHEQTEQIKNQINILKDEIQSFKKSGKVLDKDAKYDAVVLVDIPTPKRFTNAFKQYIENAKKVIYIDHHPYKFNEWEEAKAQTGVNMQAIQEQKLGLVAEAVPAATELIAIIAGKILPGIDNLVRDAKGKLRPAFVKTEEQQNKWNNFVTGIVTGMTTDTSAFIRTANLLPEHAAMPVQDRPNFVPEGLAKYLMDTTGGKVTKKWLRDELSYDISDKALDKLGYSARDLMIKYSLEGRRVYPDLSLGVVSVNYDKMNKVWQTALEDTNSKDTIFLDVQNAFKLNEVMSTLKSDPTMAKDASSSAAKQNYKGLYDDDRIAVLICQDKKKGELDEKLRLAENNGLRLSIRSSDTSDHAEVLCSLFGGGGHGGAAGGRVDLPGIELNTKLGVKINGSAEKDFAVILKELKQNLAINHDHQISDEQKKQMMKKVELVADEKGETCEGLIARLAREIRRAPKESRQK